MKERQQELEMKTVLYMAELERLHIIILEKESEGEVWVDRVSQIESLNSTKVQELKRQYEDILREKLVNTFLSLFIMFRLLRFNK